MIVLKVVATGRGWGDKIPETETKIKIAGVSCLIKEYDTWDGGSGETGEVQQYFRWSELTTTEPARNDWLSRIKNER